MSRYILTGGLEMTQCNISLPALNVLQPLIGSVLSARLVPGARHICTRSLCTCWKNSPPLNKISDCKQQSNYVLATTIISEKVVKMYLL